VSPRSPSLFSSPARGCDFFPPRSKFLNNLPAYSPRTSIHALNAAHVASGSERRSRSRSRQCRSGSHPENP